MHSRVIFLCRYERNVIIMYYNKCIKKIYAKQSKVWPFFYLNNDEIKIKYISSISKKKCMQESKFSV